MLYNWIRSEFESHGFVCASFDNSYANALGYDGIVLDDIRFFLSPYDDNDDAEAKLELSKWVGNYMNNGDFSEFSSIIDFIIGPGYIDDHIYDY